MPYDIVMRGGKHCVVKQAGGRTMGCHDSHAKAERQRRALYAGEASSQRATVLADMEPDEPREGGPIWEAVLAIEGHPTSDGRYLIPGKLSERELPLSLMVKTVTAEGHTGAELGGRIDEVARISVESALNQGHLSLEKASKIGPDAIVVIGRGVFDSSDFGIESARLVDEQFLTGVSIDLGITNAVLLDAETLEEVDPETVDMMDILTGSFLTGIEGEIMGATLCPFPAFEEATVRIIGGEEPRALAASAYGIAIKRPRPLVAAGGPLKPSREWFENPGLQKLTPLMILEDGRVYGHLADWDGCHTGFGSVCVPPFHSASDYAYFNTGEIETAEGVLVPCGKIMFCREGNGHAPLDPNLSWQEISRYYDDATKVGAYVRAGSDRFGTWLAGVLRSDLSDEDVQHLRTHPPSGDWRPIPGKGTELVASFAVPIPGFPIPRSLAASGADGQMMFITGPLIIEPVGDREFRRRKKMLADRAYALLGENTAAA